MNKLITHIVVGYPSFQHNQSLIRAMVKSGVKKIELQIPFTDPLADGPIITAACHDSIKDGFNFDDFFSLINEVVIKFPQIDFYIMSYFNLIYNFGVKKFLRISSENGIKGVIIPDIPYELALKEGLLKECKKNKLNLINVISPNISDLRLKNILSKASDFIYLTQVSGTTGVRLSLNKKAVNVLKRIRQISNIEIALGFGISTKDQVKEVCQNFDYAILGSAILKRVKDKEAISKIGQFISELIHA